jgi:hypothetical protein
VKRREKRKKKKKKKKKKEGKKRKKERKNSEIYLYIFSNKRWSVLSGIARYISFILSLCQF